MTGQVRIARSKADLGELRPRVPDTFPFDREAIAIIPGSGAPVCCERVPVIVPDKDGTISVGAEGGDRVAGTTLVAVFIRQAKGQRDGSEVAWGRPPAARLIRVPTYVTHVIVEVFELPPRP